MSTQTDFDITIIGAGIHGAGIAQAAAAKGHSVLLLEQYSSAAEGTSSKSSKLIHGGLRYLEQGDLKLVYECLQERKYLLSNAPGLVKLRPFYIPLYTGSKIKPWKLRAGLSLYSILAGLGEASRFHTLAKSSWPELHGLRQTGLRSVFCYSDAQTDDSRLTQAVIQSAVNLGAQVTYNALFKQADKIESGYRIKYSVNDEEVVINSRTLVHATGPWVNQSMGCVKPAINTPEIDLVQGTHIVLPGSIGEDIFYLPAPDGRAIFVMPWNEHIMVGTTEHIHHGDPADCAPTEHEINYLLTVFNHFFPKFYPGGAADTKNIVESFAGLRVLPKNSKNPFKRTRETLFVKDTASKPNLVAIYGGKLTSYRATAEKTLAILKAGLPRPTKNIDTRTIKL